MSQAARATNRGARKTKPSIGTRIGIGLLGVLLLAAVVILATLYFGKIGGEEFSPTRFQRRVFAYVEIPLLKVQVSPISRSDTTGDLEKYLVTKKLLGTNTKEPRWDLVWANSGGPGGQHGEARILCTYLDSVNDEGKIAWLAWTEDNTDLAKIVWPAIAKLAGQELYSFVPDLFVLARSATDKEELQREVDLVMARSYVFVGRALQAVDNDEKAVVFFSKALTHQPGHIDALTGRAESYQTLGDIPSADADRIRLQVLSVEESS
ncbi:MAG: hypothetical protein CMJ64_26545 [Planctomycetaceae bacterium]|nr:hypothetical protein [Planctomycetaceae bacterium]